MFSREQFVTRLSDMEKRLRPIAKGQVDVTDPHWFEKMQKNHPLDQAGVRATAQDLLHELIDAYASEDDAAREIIRALFREFSSFAWATMLRVPSHTKDGFRAHLLHFSVMDQGDDPRDAKVWLDTLWNTAREAHVDVRPILREVAALSSREDRYRWGSTHDWLQKLSTQ